MLIVVFLPTPGHTQSTSFAVRLPGHASAVRVDSGATIVPIAAPAARVFQAARQILAEQKITVQRADSAQGYLVNQRFIKMRELAGSPLSTYLNCGVGITGPNADTFRVTMAFGLFIVPQSATTSTLRLALFAGAETTEGASKGAVVCASSGVLEERLGKLIRARVPMLGPPD